MNTTETFEKLYNQVIDNLLVAYDENDMDTLEGKLKDFLDEAFNIRKEVKE